jgi:GNAT superfamily N-acetyltransferase
MSDGVWDLGWIGVHPSQQGKGYGKLLLQFVEGIVKKNNARLLLIETSVNSPLK